MHLQRSFFSEDGYKKSLGFNINLWKGFYVSARQLQCGYNINFDGKMKLNIFDFIYLK